MRYSWSSIDTIEVRYPLETPVIGPVVNSLVTQSGLRGWDRRAFLLLPLIVSGIWELMSARRGTWTEGYPFRWTRTTDSEVLYAHNLTL